MASFTPIIHTYTTDGLRMVVNVFVLETERGVVVIDGATALCSSDEVRSLIETQIRKPLLAILLTHGHPDHYVGTGRIRGTSRARIVATHGAADSARRQDEKKRKSLSANYGANWPQKREFPDRIVGDGDTIVLDGVSFHVHDLGPCESDSDALWTTVIGGVDHVFVGDVVYNHTHCYMHDGHALHWLQALDSLLKRYDHTAVLHCGHGVDCGPEIIHWQKAYIEAFLGTMRSVLGKAGELSDAAKELLVRRMKSFLPSEAILFLMASGLDETVAALRANGAL
jgi:glyoxylase-like metal-dependent hydrolase (beta-lactamase superfamily II)